MHSLTYCSFIFLIISLCIAARAKPLNGCGYEVKNFEDSLLITLNLMLIVCMSELQLFCTIDKKK
jgi:hypothetical protein